MTESERTARAALSRLFEPQDAAGLALVRIAGAEDALRIATGQLTAGAGAGTGDVPAPGRERLGRRLDGPGDGPETLGAEDPGPGTGPGPRDDAAARRTHDHSVGRTLAPATGRPWTAGTDLPLVARRRAGAASGRQVRCTGRFPGQHLLRLVRDGRPRVFAGPAGVHDHLGRRLRDRCARPPGGPGRRHVREPAHHRRDGRGSGPLLPFRQRGPAAGRRQPGRGPGRGSARLGAHAVPVPAAEQAHRRAGLGHGRCGSPVEVRRPEHGPPCGNPGQGRRRGAGVGAQRQLRGLPPAAPRRRGGLRHRRRGDRRARLAQRRIAARGQDRPGGRSTTA